MKSNHSRSFYVIDDPENSNFIVSIHFHQNLRTPVALENFWLWDLFWDLYVDMYNSSQHNKNDSSSAASVTLFEFKR